MEADVTLAGREVIFQSSLINPSAQHLGIQPL